MSDDATQPDENPDIRVLRENAAANKQTQAENADLKRKLLFAQAGIDTTDAAPKLAKMLFSSFEGDTLDALKAEATEIGLLKAPEAPKDTPHPDAGQDAMRRDLAGGGGPEPDRGPDPWDAGYEQFHRDRSRGVPREIAQLALVDRVIAAGAVRDPRVMFDKRSWQEQAETADSMALL